MAKVGAPKGTPSRTGKVNKSKQRLFKALQQEYGEEFSPIMKMAEHATAIHEYAVTIEERLAKTEEAIDIADSLDKPAMKEKLDAALATLDLITARFKSIEAWEKIAPYIDYKLKAVEYSGEVSLNMADLSDRELNEKLQEKLRKFVDVEQGTDSRVH